MADLDDVANTLCALVAGIVYPNGTGKPPIAGTTINIAQGWPVPAQLDASLAAGNAQISVYPRPEERNMTRYVQTWQEVSRGTATLSLTVSGETVTLAGTIPPITNPQNLLVMAAGIPFIYGVQVADTLTSAAAALASRIAVGIPGTTSAGAVITLPAGTVINRVNVGVVGQTLMEVRRQQRTFQIGIWAPTPAIRTTLAKAIDPVLAGMNFLVFPDLSAGRLIYKGSPMTDAFEKQALYRRDLLYTVEYPTLETQTSAEILATELQVAVAVSGVPPYVEVATEYSAG